MKHQFLYQRATGNTAGLSDSPEIVERSDRIGQFDHSKYVLAQIVDPDLPQNKEEFTEMGGSHLGTIRSWIQWNCLNGDSVTWGSQDPLKFKGSITVKEFETLAVDIAYNIMKEKGFIK
jgi:hypothetical protein